MGSSACAMRRPVDGVGGDLGVDGNSRWCLLQNGVHLQKWRAHSDKYTFTNTHTYKHTNTRKQKNVFAYRYGCRPGDYENLSRRRKMPTSSFKLKIIETQTFKMSNFAIIILELDLNNHFHAHISYLITRDALTRGTIVYMYYVCVAKVFRLLSLRCRPTINGYIVASHTTNTLY